MARLLGFITNRADLGERVVAQQRAHLNVEAPTGSEHGFGIAFFSGGDVLLTRKPIDDRPRLNMADLVAGIRTDLLLAHIRPPASHPLAPEGVQPIRYRDMMFAMTGSIPGFERSRHRIRESIPSFLVRNLREDSEAEHFFFLFLGFLHDAGALGESTSNSTVHAALGSALTVIDRIGAEDGHPPARVNAMIASPSAISALRAGSPMGYLVAEGPKAMEALLGDSSLGRTRLPDLAPCRVTLIASDFAAPDLPAGFTPLASKSVATFERLRPPVIDAIA